MADMGKTLSVCLLGASFRTSNLGVSALAAGAIKALFVQFPGADLKILDYGHNGHRSQLKVCGKTVLVETVFFV